MEEREEIAREIGIELSDLLKIEQIIFRGQFIRFRGELLKPPEEAFQVMKERLEKKGYLPFLEEEEKKVVLKIAALKKEGKKPNPLFNLLLFLATIGTTLLAGAFQREIFNPFLHPQKIYLGIPFSFAIMTILGIHELGHYLVSRKHGIKASLPYFIPLPPLFILGTLGAVIKMRSPIPDRKSLFDVGVAGPLAGFFPALIALIIGLLLSPVVKIPLEEDMFLVFGDSILTLLLTRFIVSPPQGYSILLHPIAFAGWICLLITALNLFPIGQFDGGHVTYALFGKKHRVIARSAFFFILLLGSFGLRWPGWFWPGWLVWAFLFLIMGLDHPPPLNDLAPLDAKRKVIALIALAILIISFVPIPVR
jgi:membrane-associated protease RseP (regulator of RpoE activity)